MGISVKRAKLEDSKALQMLVFEMLCYGKDMPTMEILPTKENAETYVREIIIPSIKNNEPIFLCFDGHLLCGGIWWSTVKSPFKTKKQYANGGTFVFSKHRNKGCGRALRKAALLACKESGIEEIRGVIDEMNDLGQAAKNEKGVSTIGDYCSWKV